ncbi:MAG: hypothetical protein IM638_10550 [Bacteroidetes bacterium]|nr:hypothetical protein [Bacteroidota bacterium]
MATDVDLLLSINLEIGSIPVSLSAEMESTSTGTVYTFDGCLQNADIDLGKFISLVATQFGVNVMLPPELDVKAVFNYVSGQIIYSIPTSGNTTTELGVAAEFELFKDGDSLFKFNFYADTILNSSSPDSGNPYVIGASIDTNLEFSKLPLVGSIPGFKDLTLTNLGFSYTNLKPSDKGTEFNIPVVTKSANPLYTRSPEHASNSKIYTINTDGPKKSMTINKNGFSFTVGLTDNSTGNNLNNFSLPVNLNPAPPNPTQIPTTFNPGKTSPPDSPVNWMKLNKTFGPVTLNQIGFNYSEGEATFGFSAGFAVGGFSMYLDQLAITFPMPLPGIPAGNRVGFDLQGMGMDFKKGTFQIGGAFLKYNDGERTNYYGQAMLRMGKFGFKALGGYTPAQQNDPASFFIYANITVPLGGPPEFFITGLAGGFGINNALVMPTIETLSSYPLLPGNAPPVGSDPASTISTVLPALGSIFTYSPGAYWLAAGIQFTTYEMIEAFILATVTFGVDFQVGLLGTASMSMPPAVGTPVAYIEIDIMAAIIPASGLAAVAGVISPSSFIWGGFVKLTGGFAFYLWFSGEHAGDFVMTIGGYHPAFQKPAWYPTVPRLGMSFNLGPFSVIGQAYFALTAGAMMAGGSLSATWNLGPIKAWFNTGIDFMIRWAPFHYEASFYINVGCSVDMGLFTLNLSAGAMLAIWGPEFGGTAEVDLDVVSFTIYFGGNSSMPQVPGWNTFKSTFLPPDTTVSPSSDAAPKARALQLDENSSVTVSNVVKASAAEGLLQSDTANYDWILDADHFQIVTNSTIPANNATWATAGNAYTVSNNVSDYNVTPPNAPATNPWMWMSDDTLKQTYSPTQVWNTALHISPMNVSGIQSTHSITLSENGTPLTSFAVQPVIGRSSWSLWGTPASNPGPNDPRFVESTLTGFSITPVPRTPAQTNNVPLLQLLFASGFNTGFSYEEAVVNTVYTVNADVNSSEDLLITISGGHTASFTNINYILSTLTDSWVTSQRNDILTDLVNNNFNTLAPAEVNITEFATQTPLANWPVVEQIGSMQPASPIS